MKVVSQSLAATSIIKLNAAWTETKKHCRELYNCCRYYQIHYVVDIAIGIASSFDAVIIAVDIASSGFGCTCCCCQIVGPAVELALHCRFCMDIAPLVSTTYLKEGL